MIDLRGGETTHAIAAAKISWRLALVNKLSTIEKTSVHPSNRAMQVLSAKSVPTLTVRYSSAKVGATSRIDTKVVISKVTNRPIRFLLK